MSPDTLLYNILFFVALAAVVLICWLIFFGVRRKNRKKLDDATMVNGMCQTGLNHRFNTPGRSTMASRTSIMNRIGSSFFRVSMRAFISGLSLTINI